MFLKQKVANVLRTTVFQPLWERLYAFSKIGMNYWGGASLYESGELAVLEHLAKRIKGDEIVVFDVGANDGHYTEEVVRVIGKRATVHAFEPSRPTFEKLSNLFAGNSNVLAFQLGLSRKEEVLQLHATHEGATTASLYKPEEKTTHIEQVSLTTLDKHCINQGVDKIDFLKIDVEGHELSVLEGAIRMLREKKIRFVQFEFGECHIDSKTFLKDFYKLFGNNARFYRVVRDGLRPIGNYKPTLEVFNTANYFVELL